MNVRQAFAAGLLAMIPALTGCLSHTRSVQKTRRADVVLDATLAQLLQGIDQRYNAIQSATLWVDVIAATGGSLQGQVKEYTSLHGFIILGKPEQIRVILQVPLLGSKMMDMVSDGKTFTMLIPPRNCALEGADEVVDPTQKGLYSLRPGMILDSVLVRGLQGDQIVSLTQDIRVIENPKKKNDLIERPDYDMEFLSQPKGQTARTLHVVHVSRTDLLPYQQDIYDADGHVVTRALYSNYRKFGDVNFPSKITIKRPIDELSLDITVAKGTMFNQHLDDDAFKLDLPPGLTAQNMDRRKPGDPVPCAAHATQ